MCMVNVPCEYGITPGQKLKIGMQITNRLLEKIHHDLVWWKNPNQVITDQTQLQKTKSKNVDFKDENESWDQKGLDFRNLEKHNRIKSHWRHVRSRFYFTSASHMYTLLNVIKFGLSHVPNSKTISTTNQKLAHSKLEDAHRLDFISGIFFRVFENLVSEENDPARFKLEIMVNRGSTLDPNKVKDIENHCIEIKLDNCYTKTLTLDDVDSFFNVLLDMHEVNSADKSNSHENQD